MRKIFVGTFIAFSILIRVPLHAEPQEQQGAEGETLIYGMTCTEREDYIRKIEGIPEASDKIVAAKWYESGKCVPPDYRKAAELYLFATKEGQNSALVLLGYIYAKGLGVARDVEEASYWFKRFALTTLYKDKKERLEDTREILGEREMPPELADEIAWAGEVKAADAREQYRIALKLRDGDGLPMDRKAAFNLLLNGITKNLPEAMYEMSRGLIAREYFHLNVLRDETVKWAYLNFWSAAKARYAPAEKALGLIFANPDSKKVDYTSAYILLLRAKAGGENGVDQTLHRLEGTLSEKDKARGRRLADKPTWPIPMAK